MNTIQALLTLTIVARDHVVAFSEQCFYSWSVPGISIRADLLAWTQTENVFARVYLE
jgi:hypothetical protein